MHTCKYPHIFEPMTIKGVTFKNRVFASPITANRVVDHGYPTPEGIDAYETRPGAVLHLLHSQNPLSIMSIPGVMSTD